MKTNIKIVITAATAIILINSSSFAQFNAGGINVDKFAQTDNQNPK
jgi:hypothetical protein